MAVGRAGRGGVDDTGAARAGGAGDRGAANRGRQEHSLHAAGSDAGDRDERGGGAVRGAGGRLDRAGTAGRCRLHPLQEQQQQAGAGDSAEGGAACSGRGGDSDGAGVRGVCRWASKLGAARADLSRRVPHSDHRPGVPGEAGGAAGAAPVRAAGGDADGDAAGGAGGVVPAGYAGNGGDNRAGADDEGELPVPGSKGEGRAGGKEGSGGDGAAGGADDGGREGGGVLPVAGPV